MNSLEGELCARGLRFGLIAGRFNEMITSKLVESATNCLLRHGAKTDDICVTWVPGSFEIPLTALKMSQGHGFHALIALGAVIRGETSHFDYVCRETARGISSVSLQSGIPVIFGVLTTDTVEQAMDRIGLKGGNKGHEAAMSAMEMANLMKRLHKSL